MISKRQWAKVLETERLYRDCMSKGGHIDSGERSEAILGGEPCTMATCSRCTVRYPAPQGA